MLLEKETMCAFYRKLLGPQSQAGRFEETENSCYKNSNPGQSSK